MSEDADDYHGFYDQYVEQMESIRAHMESLKLDSNTQVVLMIYCAGLNIGGLAKVPHMAKKAALICLEAGIERGTENRAAWAEERKNSH